MRVASERLAAGHGAKRRSGVIVGFWLGGAEEDPVGGELMVVNPRVESGK